MPDFNLLFILTGLIIGLFELHQNTKSRYIQIQQEAQKQYDNLNEDRRGFYLYYRKKVFDLKKLKKENPNDYEKIINWEQRFFWFNFYRWLEGKRKDMPNYLKKDWEHAIRASMKNPVHSQAWEEEIQKTDFLGYNQFNKFIDKAIRNQK